MTIEGDFLCGTCGLKFEVVSEALAHMVSHPRNEVRIDVLDKGYVRLVDWMGTDLSVVNAARVSFLKETQLFDDKDRALVNFLARRRESSPFRHAFLSLEIKAPLMVARQHWKYIVGGDHTMDAWNEASRRYVTMEPEFYVPDRWRLAPDNRKQGSSDECLDDYASVVMRQNLTNAQGDALHDYEDAMHQGVAPELARLFLPAYALYTVYRWSTSLNAILHFLDERLVDKAQWEIQQYAVAIAGITRELFPASYAAWLGESNEPER